MIFFSYIKTPFFFLLFDNILKNIMKKGAAAMIYNH